MMGLALPPAFGDVYQHIVVSPNNAWPPIHLLWLRVLDHNGQLVWQSVTPGHERDDGCVLALTPTTDQPRWVEKAWYDRNLSRRQQ